MENATREIYDIQTEEFNFWKELTEGILKPESANLSKGKEIKKSLKDLRNFSLLIVLLTNIVWIVFLYALVFRPLAKYNLPVRAFSLLFLMIFSIIVLIQFVAMLFHRFMSMLHVLARVKIPVVARNNSRSATTWQVVSGRP